MEIIESKSGLYQLIDEANGNVLFQGLFEDCQMRMWAEEENRLYRDFLLYTGI
jgi:hypothetical protein